MLLKDKNILLILGIDPINIDALQDEHKINNSFYCDYEKYGLIKENI